MTAAAHSLPPLVTRQRNAILAVLLVATAAAWIAVIGYDMDEHAHGAMAMELDLTMGMGALPYIGMWAAMMAAMMFPASAPMILIFARMERGRRPNAGPYVPTLVFVAAYLAVWVAVGVAAYGVSVGVESLVGDSPSLAATWGRVGGAVLLVAGIYQLTPLKDRCLSRCRTPLGFLMQAWRPGRWGALLMGLRHAGYCVGCCWLLFAVLVVLGVMSIAAMLAVAVVVFAEKALPGGERLAQVAAVALLLLGAGAVIEPGLLPSAVTG